MGKSSRMASQASSKPDSGFPSTATLGFEADVGPIGIRNSGFVISPARRLAICGIEARLWLIGRTDLHSQCSGQNTLIPHR